MQKLLNQLLVLSCLLAIMAFASAILCWKSMSASQWLAHAFQVLYEQSDLLSACQDINIYSRGYRLSDDPIFLGRYQTASADAERLSTQLRLLTSDSSIQQKNLKEMASQLEALKRNSKNLLSLKSEVSGDTKTVILDQKASMDRLRSTLNEVVIEETRVLKQRQSEANLTQILVWFSLALTFGCAGLVVVLLFKGLGAYDNESRRAFSDVARARDEALATKIIADEANTKLKSSNADLQQFAYVASHDLQEPLRAVSGFLALLKMKQGDKLDDESLVWINHSMEGAERMRRLIIDLLSYSRVESRGGALTTVDLNVALRQAVENLSVLIDETSTKISSVALPAGALGELSQLTLLFQNLLANAIKFRKPDEAPVVSITCVDDEALITLSVRDNGIGFDMEHHDRIYVIFQRLHTREDYAGTGIGLAICKKIVERHGGQLWATSKPGEGAEFSFTLSKQKI